MSDGGALPYNPHSVRLREQDGDAPGIGPDHRIQRLRTSNISSRRMGQFFASTRPRCRHQGRLRLGE